MEITIGKNLIAKVQEQKEEVWKVIFNIGGKKLEQLIDKLGQVPLPPYIKSKSPLDQYQTVYARERGSVAAPTAGLHMTKRLLAELKKQKVQIEYVTLHVGLGTFKPIESRHVEDHRIHSEYATVAAETAKRINKALAEGRRIIAVGTTAVRTLEAFASKDKRLTSGTKAVNLFILPGYNFKIISGLVTNFHLPKSSLLVLVSAFAGHKNTIAAYKAAAREHYRFYSFGDAMIIL